MISRRAFAGWLLVAAANVGFADPESLPVRRARFVESNGRLRMQFDLTELLPRRDRDAAAHLSSGFATRFVYMLTVYDRHRSERRVVTRVRRELSVHFDPWRNMFVAQLQDEQGRKTQLTLATADEVRHLATRLNVDLGPLQLFERGDKQHYFVRVLGLRNPKEEPLDEDGRRRRHDDGRGLSVFARWVRLFVRQAPRADAEVEVRSGGFYLRASGRPWACSRRTSAAEKGATTVNQPRKQVSPLARLLARRRKVWKRRFYRGRGRYRWWSRWWGRLSSRFITTLVALGAFVVLSTGLLVRAALNYFERVIDEQVAAGERAYSVAQPMYREFVAAKRQGFHILADALILESATLSEEQLKRRLSLAVTKHEDLLSIRWQSSGGHLGVPEIVGASGSFNDAAPDKPVRLTKQEPGQQRSFEFAFARDRQLESEFRALEQVRASLNEVEFAGRRIDRGEFEVGLLSALVAAAGVVCGVALSVGWVLSRRATRKLDEIGLVMRQVARGQLDARVSRLGTDELGELARLFNAMLDQLAHMRNRVEYLQRVGIWQDMAQRMAHEIKNPLTPIQLAVQQLRDKYPRATEPNDRFARLLHQAVEIVEDEVESLRRLVTSFSQFTRVPEVILKPIEVGQLLAEFRRGYGHLSDRDEDALEIDPGHRGLELAGDRQLLKHVLANLVENAVLSCRAAGPEPIRVAIAVREEFTESPPEKQPTVAELALQLAAQEGEGELVKEAPAELPAPEVLCLSVEDNGPGIPEQMRDRVFEPYETSREEGTGLGLAIAKKVVLDHGGRILACTGAMGGARIEIRLPVIRVVERPPLENEI